MRWPTSRNSITCRSTRSSGGTRSRAHAFAPAIRSSSSPAPEVAAYGDYENAIYLAGLRGVLPALPVDYASLRERACAALPESVFSYVDCGAGDEHTQELNVAAFRHWGLVPRMMVDTSRRDLSIELCGLTLPSPLFMCPIGVIGMCAADGHGDIATARAAAESGVPMMASTLSNDP